MQNKLQIIFLLIIGMFGYSMKVNAQLKADSIFLYYGMTQTNTVEPLMDYIENLETSGEVGRRQLAVAVGSLKDQRAFIRINHLYPKAHFHYTLTYKHSISRSR